MSELNSLEYRRTKALESIAKQLTRLVDFCENDSPSRLPDEIEDDGL